MKFRELLSSLFKTNEEEPPTESMQSLVERDSMIEGVRRLSGKTVKEIMVPRVDVTALPITVADKELLDTVIDSGFSRLPVYNDTIDDVVGVIYVKDLFKRFKDENQKEDLDIKTLLHIPYFVPESIKLNVLLGELKKRKTHIAIVVDEYGGVSGIVSMEDVVEEIVGNIQDEFDKEEKEEIIQLDSHTYFCDARVNLDTFNESLGVAIEEDVETLGGFLFDFLGRIPSRFERIQYKNLTFIVQSMEGNKIEQVKVLLGDNHDKDS